MRNMFGITPLSRLSKDEHQASSKFQSETPALCEVDNKIEMKLSEPIVARS
jgi:hypothetical protein